MNLVKSVINFVLYILLYMKMIFEFEELMLRTPFDFSTLQFKLSKCDDGSTPMKRHRNCNADELDEKPDT